MSENLEINEPELISNDPPKRGRGRPRKPRVETKENMVETNENSENEMLIPVKRGRGRPRKIHDEASENPGKDPEEQPPSIPIKRGRGRPRLSQEIIKTTAPPVHIIKKRRLAKSVKDKPEKRRNKMTIKSNTLKPKISIKKIINKTCAVSSCHRTSTDPGRPHIFHPLPNDARRSIWMYVSGITSTCDKRIYICDSHFKKEDYFPSKTQLRHSAVPTRRLPPQENLLHNKDIFNDLTLNPSDITVKLHDTIKLLNRFKKRNADKYTDLLLSFYLKHCSAYKMLEKPLGLLSTLQLKKVIYDNPIGLARSSNLINKKLLKIDDRDKVCFVSCIEMAIEPKILYSSKSDKIIGITSWKNKVAESVNILIAHGVNSEWHIPLDIVYINNNFNLKHYIKNWIEQTLKTYGILEVYGFAWFPNHADFLNSSSIFATLDTLNLDFNNQHCHTFFDLHFLLRLLYFNLKCSNYSFGEFSANLKDLKKLYAIDSKRTYPLAPNLSDYNVNFSTFDHLTFEHIKEVFSDETVAALRTYTKAQLIEAEGTAVFVENIIYLMKLFDSNVKLTNDEIESIINKVQQFLKTIKSDRVNHFIDHLSMIMDINKDDPEFFSNLSKYLVNNYIHKFVDDILSNSVGEKPTSMDIEKAFRKSYVENLLKPMKRNISFNEALDLAQKHLVIEPMCLLKINETQSQIKPSDYKLYMLDRKDRILYVAGYILKKCTLYHDNCSIFKDYVNSNTDDDKLLSESIQKEIEQGICSILKIEFVEFIEAMEILFLGQFPKLAMRDFFIKNLLKLSEMQAIRFTSACPCFPVSYARELFVHIRINYVLSYNNLNDFKSKTLQNISL